MEKILKENPGRFVIFPIEHNDIWEFYQQHQAAFWTAEEVDLTDDIRDWNKLSENEQYFVKNVLSFLPLLMVLLMKTWLRTSIERYSTLKLSSSTECNLLWKTFTR